jgi:hypothetical protein
MDSTKMVGKAVIALLILILLSGSLAAQVPMAKLIGRVMDEKGNALPGVSVVAECPRLLGKATALTDRAGFYRLFALPSGLYTVSYTLQGFKHVVRKEIVIQLEQTITLDITMEPTPQEEEITVIGKSPLIDVKSAARGQTMTKEVFMSLPRGASADALLSMMPGVQYEAIAGGISVDGASGAENVWHVDGANVTNIMVGIRSQDVVFEGIEEVQVKTSGYPAEFGGSMGGVVNVITRWGSNEFHGDVAGYFNNDKMLGHDRNYLRVKPQNDKEVEYTNDQDLVGRNFYRAEGVFNLGGYIFKDRLWFFGSFNPISNHTTANRFFLTDPEPRQMYQFQRQQWNWNGSIKLTLQPFNRLRISASLVNNFNKYRGALPAIGGSSTKDYQYGKQGFDYPNLSANATIYYTLGSNFLVSLRGGYFRTNTTNQQINNPGTYYGFSRNNNIYPEIPADLVRARGWNNGLGTSILAKYISERISANLDLTYYLSLAGEHSLKAGVQFIRLHEDVDNRPQYPLVTLGWGIPAILPDGTRVMGKYGYYMIRNGFGGPYGALYNPHSDNWTLYLQDTWTIANRLTLDLGLRAENEYVPSFDTTNPANKDYKPIIFHFADKLAPRLGIIYDVFGDSSLKIFASYGIYYDMMKLYLAEGYGGFKFFSDYYTLDDYNWTKIATSGDTKNKADQAACGQYVTSWDFRFTDWSAFDRRLKPMSQREISFGFEKKLLEDLSMSVRLVNKHLIQAVEDVGLINERQEYIYYITNPGSLVTLPVSQGGMLNDSLWPFPKAKREYWALNFSLDKRFSHSWVGGFNYTWSRLTGNYAGLASSDEGGRISPNVERNFDWWYMNYDLKGNPIDGPISNDRPHYFKAYGAYMFPFGLTVGAAAFGCSGLPLTKQVIFNNGTVYPENRMTDGRLPFTAWASLFLEYNLKIGAKYRCALNLFIDNVTNTATAQRKDMIMNRIGIPATDEEILSKNYDYKSNVLLYDPNPMYGLVTTYFPPWSARVGARFSF